MPKAVISPAHDKDPLTLRIRNRRRDFLMLPIRSRYDKRTFPRRHHSVTRLRRLLVLGRTPVTYFHDCRKLASGSRTQSRNAVA